MLFVLMPCERQALKNRRGARAHTRKQTNSTTCKQIRTSITLIRVMSRTRCPTRRLLVRRCLRKIAIENRPAPLLPPPTSLSLFLISAWQTCRGKPVSACPPSGGSAYSISTRRTQPAENVNFYVFCICSCQNAFFVNLFPKGCGRSPRIYNVNLSVLGVPGGPGEARGGGAEEKPAGNQTKNLKS